MLEAVMLLPQPLSQRYRASFRDTHRRHPIEGLVAAVVHIDVGFEILTLRTFWLVLISTLHCWVCGVPQAVSYKIDG